MEENKLVITSGRKNIIAPKKTTCRCAKVVPRKRISSDNGLPSPKRFTAITNLRASSTRRPPLGDLDTNVTTKQSLAPITKEHGPSSTKTSTVSHLKADIRLTPSRLSTRLSQRNSLKIVDRNSFDKKKFKSVLSGGKLYSPIKSNFFLPSSAIVHQGIPKVKKTLQRSEGNRFGIGEFPSDRYGSEYLEEIMLHELTKDWKYVSPKGSVPYNAMNTRAIIVNWLIQAQEVLNQPPAVLFTTVRMFDSVLAATDVSQNMYQLLGLTIMWIVTKYENNNFVTAKKLARLCNNVYTADQILKLEKKMLAFFGFDFNVPDIIFYVNFYIIKLGIPSELLHIAVHYILECYILHKASSTVIPSVQAAAAIFLALKIIIPSSKVWDSLSNIVGYYSETEMNDVIHDMLKQIHKVQDPNYECHYPYEKYSTKENLKVATVLLAKLLL
ncbi:hypothetical protein PPYR_01491 [Photinus pyralis]|uniref:Cyclin N-terminal domain-containing protein n=1 Tax=Photinus pyralis TaxID=7054 RepID=A0A5N4ATB7_PHOPY|nr:G2/mitotic-specific cyclin-B-like [Photinus pyralis]XP_031337544.1 G2/mitotic-specific cyclin-B-like [Photinus pyralis]KAB0800559.1 hypothetical protein PPYR_06299 [Photinus pyralis]KAB0804521.1 hypothetical protein PPYR_01491 [Photinus pyralis]